MENNEKNNLGETTQTLKENLANQDTENSDISKKQDKGLLGPILIIIAIVITLIILLQLPVNKKAGFDLKNNQDLEQAKNQQNIPDQRLSESDNRLGSDSARIVIVEYSDLDCPFCARFHPTMKQLVSEFPNDVAWIYRHFPLDNLHKNARLESIASECVAELSGQKAFWDFIDNAFAYTSSNIDNPTNMLSTFAEQSGIKKDEFINCLNNPEIAKLVKDNETLAIQSGASGTPFNVVIDTKTGAMYSIPGAVDIDSLRQLVKDLMK